MWNLFIWASFKKIFSSGKRLRSRNLFRNFCEYINRNKLTLTWKENDSSQYVSTVWIGNLEIFFSLYLFLTFRYLVSFVLLHFCLGSLGRELECIFESHYGWNLWPNTRQCKLTSVDLSEASKSEIHSFSGTHEEKSQATVVWFFSGSSSIDNVPKEILLEFPNINGLMISYYNSPDLRDNVFTKDFKVVKFLYLGKNKIETIEQDAFQHLTNLKWISFWQNKIQSLSIQIFRNNPEIKYIDFYKNQIVSVNPNFLDGLNKLKIVDFEENKCINEELGCNFCFPERLITPDEINQELSSCFSNCRSDPTCLLQIQTTSEAQQQ